MKGFGWSWSVLEGVFGTDVKSRVILARRFFYIFGA